MYTVGYCSLKAELQCTMFRACHPEIAEVTVRGMSLSLCSISPITSRGNDELEPNTAKLKSGQSLLRAMNIHKNIPVSVTKLTLGHRVDFISSQTTDQLFPVNPTKITGPPKIPVRNIFHFNEDYIRFACDV